MEIKQIGHHLEYKVDENEIINIFLDDFDDSITITEDIFIKSDDRIKSIEFIDERIINNSFKLLAVIENNDQNLFVYIFDENQIGFYICKNDDELPIPTYITLKNDIYRIKRVGIFDYYIEDDRGSTEVSILKTFRKPFYDEEITNENLPPYETIIYAHILEKECFITKYNSKDLIAGDALGAHSNNENIKLEFLDRNTLRITLFDDYDDVSFRLSRFNTIKLNLKCNLIKHFTVYINGNCYVAWRKGNKWYMRSGGSYSSFESPASFKLLNLIDRYMLIGRISYPQRKLMELYLQTEPTPIHLGKIHKIGKMYYAFAPKKKLLLGDSIHVPLTILDDQGNYNVFCIHKNHKSLFVFSKSRIGNTELVMRGSAGSKLFRTLVPYSREYSFTSDIKIFIARAIEKILRGKANNIKKKKLVMYFEKKSEKADESAIHVFERVLEKNPKTSINEFVLDSNASVYKELKKKYGNKIVKKYSFRHFLSIMFADYYVSSELSNHIINDRFYINGIGRKVRSTPLLFLQHGIMFAKPIDNPQAADFHKKNLRVNLQKTVVCSELESGEFFKVGYTPDDLIITGLATFDFAKLDDDADRIAYMPTYRYWEEHLVYSGHFEETSYYQDILEIINAFVKAGLADKLLIVPHNKFAKYISDAFPTYKNLLDTNPSHALKKAVVFITDYSSAIYDAIIRGAYPVFYWKHKDELIEQYQAIPPVNEENAPGPIAYSEKELIDIIKKAIKNNLVLEDEYKRKYKEINNFDDGHNTDRIVKYLIDSEII